MHVNILSKVKSLFLLVLFITWRISKIRCPKLSQLQANVCVDFYKIWWKHRFLFMHIHCARTLLRWNVLVERVDVSWKLSFSLHRSCPDGDERLRISKTSHFDFIHMLLNCLYFSPLILWSHPRHPICHVSCCFLSFISLCAFSVLCGQVLVFSTKIGNIPSMDPSSVPFHFHYWACFVC